MWDASRSRQWIRVPSATDDKYAHGVLGVITGSQTYPGAAVLGVEAAMRSGIGMVRYLGDAEPARLVLERRPEAVTVSGRVDGYLIGSGIDAASLDEKNHAGQSLSNRILDALAEAVPTVLDAGALGFVTRTLGATVITPHHRELARLLSERGNSNVVSVDEVSAHPDLWARRAAEETGATVILKGAQTCIAYSTAQGTHTIRVDSLTTWMATAGTGDVLAGITGALLATHARELSVAAQPTQVLGELAATAAFVHAEAGKLASAGGPLVALDVARGIPRVIAQLVGGEK